MQVHERAATKAPGVDEHSSTTDRPQVTGHRPQVKPKANLKTFHTEEKRKQRTAGAKSGHRPEALNGKTCHRSTLIAADKSKQFVIPMHDRLVGRAEGPCVCPMFLRDLCGPRFGSCAQKCARSGRLPYPVPCHLFPVTCNVIRPRLTSKDFWDGRRCGRRERRCDRRETEAEQLQ